MLDRAEFLRPFAHRGLHDAARGIIENTVPAFEAAMARGYGVECDLRAAAGGLPLVFHDATLERVTDAKGPVAAVTAADLKGLRHRHGGAPIATFAELLELVAGRVPLLVEMKSEWAPPDAAFLDAVARLAAGYNGPIGLMSFDPAQLTMLRRLAPGVPRGLVSGSFRDERGEPWWPELTGARAFCLRHLLAAAPVAPSFIAYDVRALPTLATRVARGVLGLPLFTWTVRTDADRRIAARYADAPIFEGYLP